MRIRSIRLRNYKSFRDTGDLAFGPGINVITGQNNAGKTALLEALRLGFGSKPHRSAETIPRPAMVPPPASSAVVQFEVEQAELADILGHTIAMFRAAPDRAQNQGNDAQLAQTTLNFIQTTALLTVECEYFADNRRADFRFTRKPSYNSYEIDSAPNSQTHRFERLPGEAFRMVATEGGQMAGDGVGSQELGLALASVLRDRTYIFRAERLNLGEGRYGPQRNLVPDASNLPEVLMGLQANRDRFDRYNALVQRILPQVERVSASPLPNDQVEIRVWSAGAPREREDLTVSLSESGTGIGQVLALLYVVVTAEFPRVIVIDEPNTFLHPGAARSLIEVLREHPLHQFIISTHSPGVVAAAEPTVIHLITRAAGASLVEQIERLKTQQVREYLREIGVSLAEVFGADAILWVEGPTEEECFPLIARDLLRRPLGATAILAVDNTGELTRRGAEAAFTLYTRLSAGPGLLPPAVGFIFDRERRPAADIEDLVRRSGGRVAFLARRTYENYLLIDEAICDVLNRLPEMAARPVTVEAVTRWIDEHGGDDRYGCRFARNDDANRWLSEVDAPKLLGDLFQQLSETRQAYSKRRDSRALTEWVLRHRPEHLRPVAAFIEERLPPLGG